MDYEKILWAVDAFSGNAEVTAHSARAVRALSTSPLVKVQPVYVCTKIESAYVLPPVPIDELMPLQIATDKLTKITQKYSLTGMQPPQILTHDGFSTRSAVKALVEYAEKNRFDAIAVGTHARKGVARFFVGSFAETLMLHSPLPVLVCNPKSDITGKIKHVVFPTNFSDSSRDVFSQAVAFAKRTRADMMVFHQFEPFFPPMTYPFVVPPVSETSVKELENSAKEHGKKWVDLAAKSGVRAKFVLARRGDLEVSTQITRAAKKLPASIIMMASESSTAGEMLLGSITRQVVRQASSPVLVIHRRARARSEYGRKAS